MKNTTSVSLNGFGGDSFSIAFYIAHRPNISEYSAFHDYRPLASGELAFIVRGTGNHWRKIFNVYAKFLFALGRYGSFNSWQSYRDERLLQSSSDEALLFSPPDLRQRHIHIIAGKTYAAQLSLPISLQWIDQNFALDIEHGIIVSPYLDYRQLSNHRIETLAQLVKKLQQHHDGSDG